MRSTRLARALLAAAVSLAVWLPPGVAAAEGPGYGGGANKLTVTRDKRGKVIVVYGVGFRGGSVIVIRVGSGAERTVAADAGGILRLLLDAGGSQGTSVLAAGRSPSGTALTLVGSVPTESADSTGGTLQWLVIAAVGLIGVGGLVGRRRRRPAAEAPVADVPAAGAPPARTPAAKPPRRKRSGGNRTGGNRTGGTRSGRHRGA